MKDNAQYSTDNSAPKRNRKSFSKIVKYYFDNSMTKSGNFVILILIIGVLLGLFMVLLQNALGLKEKEDFFTQWWNNSSNILKLGSGNNWSERVVNFIFMSCQIALAGTIIGFLSSNIRELVAKLKKGKSSVVVRDHTVILGWSNNIVSILKQLSIANKNVSNSTVVIFSSMDNEKMGDQLKSIADDIKHLKIVTRSGNSSSTAELEIANPHDAKSIIVLNEGGTSDPQVITTVLALGSILEDKKIPIIASLKSAAYADVITGLNRFQILPVLAEEIISNVTAQACRQRGLGLVFLDLLDFEGDEMYFKKVADLDGKTFREALVSFDHSSLIGLVKGGEVFLSPPADTVLFGNDQMIFISEDDDTIHYHKPDLDRLANHQLPEYVSEELPRDILFVGWSATGNVILQALMPTLHTNSKITVAYQDDYADESILPIAGDISDVHFNLIEVGDDFANITKILDDNHFDEVMIIGYAEKLSIEEADTTTLMYMLQLDSYLTKHHDKSFRVVAQVLDSSKAKLAQFTKTDELIISDNLAGLLMAQLSESPKLNMVFEHLFDQTKSNINIYPISKYAELGKTVTYAELVYAASLYNEAAIGIRRDGKQSSSHMEGLHLNPSKKMEIEPNNLDFVIVIDHPDSSEG